MKTQSIRREQMNTLAGITGRKWLGKAGRGGDVKNHGIGYNKDIRDDRAKVRTLQHEINLKALRH